MKKVICYFDENTQHVYSDRGMGYMIGYTGTIALEEAQR